MSYGRLEIYGWEAENEGLLIGDYVSIADEVKFILGGNHHYKSFSNYPFKVKLRIQKNEAYSNGPIIVEDDVWIGMGSTILSGVRIGKGSVIAAGSVIVKDVEPYSIVGGNPAKQIKMRFDKDLITKIKDFNLRDLDLEIVKKNIDIFYENLDEKNIETITKIF